MSQRIWVGESDGDVFVFDPDIQLPDCPHLFLWDPTTGEMGKYIADLTRGKVKPYSDREAASVFVASYEAWRKKEGDAWLAEEKQYYFARRLREAAENEARLAAEAAKQEAERLSRLSPAERHKARLQKLGREYKGVRSATMEARRRRVTHCYSCKAALDNSIDVECVACGWIICACGACGCEYAR